MFKWIQQIIKRGSVETPNVPISSADIWNYLGGSPSASGVEVNKQTVLGSSAVWRAINLISSSIARLPIITYEKKPDGTRVRAISHPAYFLLKKQPAPYLSAYCCVQTTQAHALLHGNGYAYITRDDLANPLELTLLDPTQTTWAKENGKLIYVTRVDDEDIKLLPENVLHIKGLGYDGFGGYPVIEILKETFGGDLAVQKFGNTFFKHGSAINVIIELPGYFKDKEAISRFRDTWGDMHTGLNNAHKVAILENGAKASRLAYTNEEAQYLQSKEFNLKALANVFGLPASYLNASYNTSYGSLEAENKQFLNHSLGGWLAGWEQELESKLLTYDQLRNDTHFIEFERKALEQADLTTEITALVTQVNNGLLTLNEARDILNKPRVEGGDEVRIPQKAPAIAPEQAQEQQEDKTPEESEDVARALANVAFERFIERLKKDSKPFEIERHLPVLVRDLAPLKINDKLEQWLVKVTEELEAVLPEQRAQILDNQKLGSIWKTKN